MTRDETSLGARQGNGWLKGEGGRSKDAKGQDYEEPSKPLLLKLQPVLETMRGNR